MNISHSTKQVAKLIGGQTSSSALSLSPQKTSTLDPYSTEALCAIQNQLKIIQQHVPNLITKGVVYDGQRPWFSGGITPKYHPDFSKIPKQVGAIDKHATLVGIGGVAIIDIDDTPMFEKHYPDLLKALDGNTPQYLSRNKKEQHYMVHLKNAPTKPCTKMCVGKTHVFDVLNGKQAAWCRHPIQNIEKESKN